MKFTSNQKGIAASAGLLTVAVLSAASVIYDNLHPSVLSPAPQQHPGVVSYPLTARMGGTLLEARSSRIDSFLNHAHIMQGVSIKTKDTVIEAKSGTMFPGEDSLILEDAVLKASHLRGRIGTLVIRDRRIVFENVHARGTIAPLSVRRFEAGRISLPKTFLDREGAGLGGIVDAVSAKTRGKRDRSGEIHFGFRKLELVLTVLFQRAYISRAHIHLSDGTKASFRRGTYSARHEKIYIKDAFIETERGKLRAEKAEIQMKTGRLILFSPVEKIENGTTDTIRKAVVVDLK